MKIEKWDKSTQENIQKEITAKPVQFMKRDNAKVEKIRNLCKLSKQAKELYTPMLEAYDNKKLSIEDLLVEFAMMEMNRKTSGFTYWNCNKWTIQATDHHEKTVDEEKDDT